MDFISFQNTKIEWIIYIGLSILLGFVAYKLLFKGVVKPKFDSIIFFVRIKERRAFLFWSLMIAVLTCIFAISEDDIMATCMATLIIVIDIIDLSKTRTNGLVLLDNELVIIRRDKIVKRVSLGKVKKVIFLNEKVKLYTTRYFDEVKLEDAQKDKQKIISILSKMEIKVFDN